MALTMANTSDMTDIAAEVAAGSFAHGFVGTDGTVSSPYCRGWRRLRVGSFEFAAHPSTAVAHQGREPEREAAGAIFGQVADLDRSTADAEIVLRRLLATVHASGLEAGTRYAASLGGRWAAVVEYRGDLHVLHDSHAAQSVYWANADGRVVMASHAALCADEARADLDEPTLLAFSKIREVRPKGTVFLPGARTPFSGVRPIMATCRLEIAPGGPVRHRRYWPFEPVRSASARSAFHEFSGSFDRHVELLASLGRVGLSLTAGGDSAVTLAALARIRPRAAFSFTYLNPRDLSHNAGAADDLFGASARAFEAQLPHKIIRWRLPPAEDPFETMITQMWPHLRPSIGAAFAMYRDLPRGFFEFQSTVSETGTAFYRSRTNEGPTAERLTTLWAGSAAAKRREFVEAFEEYIEYADFRE